MMKMVQIEYLSKMDSNFDDNHRETPKYFAPADMKIEVGDIVLVGRYDNAMTVGQVKNIHEENINMTNHNKRFNVLDVITDSCPTFKQKYNEVARKRIKKQMEVRARELDKLLQYENYATYDEEFKNLLTEFKAKGGFNE